MTPAQVLAVHAEPLVAGRRVALLAPEDPALVDALLGLGARLLYVYDPRPGVEGGRRSDPRVTVAPLRAGDLGVREGAFDLALVPDLGLLGDAEASLAYVRRLVGSGGCALVATRNDAAKRTWLAPERGTEPEGGKGPGYTEFYDLCALQFAEVRMAGVAPFAAYAIAEFAPEREPVIAFDASLVAAPETPEWFLAIASQSAGSALEAYQIVQVPRADLASAAPESEATVSAAADGDLRAQLANLEQKRTEAEARAGEEVLRGERLTNELRTQGEELRKLRERSAQQARELEDERRARERLFAELEAAKRDPERARLDERVLALEAELIEARTQLATPRAAPAETRLREERDALAQEVATLRASLQQTKGSLEDLRHRLGERERELHATLARAKGLEDRLAEQLAEAARHDEARAAATAAVQRAQQLEVVAQRLDAELAALQATHEQDVAQLEAALRLAGEELRAAKHELARRERMIRELVAQVETPDLPMQHAGAEPPLALVAELELARRELGALVEEVKRRERALEEVRLTAEEHRRALESERAKNESLARDAARREAALQTAAWRITELEKLGESALPSSGNPALDAELDALRRALTQEHARVEELERRLAVPTDAAELARVKSRLQEQETLIEQLSAQLAARGA